MADSALSRNGCTVLPAKLTSTIELEMRGWANLKSRSFEIYTICEYFGLFHSSIFLVFEKADTNMNTCLFVLE